ncbi:adenosylcobinamide-GDP ribazoletransferase [Rossellomorea sp. YZS02]|uniref:adenosylcobinamide-GDP ribazoletransferase n=1 Tax=Rossellomorea sp. YZS02 TaxID=3097358 RepID=UPI002A0D8166|nr:adenosylcobinamide-GDP ribazoletransferase [Rossellomorea sp. YZS02]MDX8344471.1 adenosylcobinamide-GDP ribazoletransferase [Rossellomorea sp. YZS02]
MILLKSVLLNIQFFTVLPIRIEFLVGKYEIKWMVRTFPLVGFSIGIFLSIGYLVLDSFTQMSPLALSFYIWVLPIILTGGLHLDGYMDASDAFFSYRDKEKRLEIMKDPRVGAFGVLSLLVMLSSRFVFIYETVLYTDSAVITMVLMWIPFFSRIVMGASLILIAPAQKSGMGFSFSKYMTRNELFFLPAYFLVGGICSFLQGGFYLYITFSIVTIGFFLFVYVKSIKWFGGMTGDTVGASVEGMEWMLWMTLWLLPLSDMV